MSDMPSVDDIDSRAGEIPERQLAALARLIAVMDVLRSPGGCPWDAAQTHQTLVKHCIEESYELAEAVEAGDRAELREELGDVLLQVVFHSRVAEEDADDPFDIGDVADGVAAKLIRRHPHVFATGEARGMAAEDSHKFWDAQKAEEKADRRSAADGVPLDMGALARAGKLLARARRDLEDDVVTGASRVLADDASADPAAAEIGRRLLTIAAEADSAGIEAEAAMRAANRALEESIRQAERGRDSGA